MKQRSLNLLTPEEAQYRIFSLTMARSLKRNLHAYEKEKKCRALIREVVRSGIDLAHIDEYPNPPTRAPYQWFLDLAIWGNHIFKGETVDGGTIYQAMPKLVHYEKMAILAEVVDFRSFQTDGRERWPEDLVINENVSRPDPNEIGVSLSTALLNETILRGPLYIECSPFVLKILEHYWKPEFASKKEVADSLSEVLSNSTYRSYGAEPFQRSYELISLFKLAKSRYPDLSTDDVRPREYFGNRGEWKVWEDPKFEDLRDILQEQSPAPRKQPRP